MRLPQSLDGALVGAGVMGWVEHIGFTVIGSGVFAQSQPIELLRQLDLRGEPLQESETAWFVIPALLDDKTVRVIGLITKAYEPGSNSRPTVFGAAVVAERATVRRRGFHLATRAAQVLFDAAAQACLEPQTRYVHLDRAQEAVRALPTLAPRHPLGALRVEHLPLQLPPGWDAHMGIDTLMRLVEREPKLRAYAENGYVVYDRRVQRNVDELPMAVLEEPDYMLFERGDQQIADLNNQVDELERTLQTQQRAVAAANDSIQQLTFQRDNAVRLKDTAEKERNTFKDKYNDAFNDGKAAQWDEDRREIDRLNSRINTLEPALNEAQETAKQWHDAAHRLQRQLENAPREEGTGGWTPQLYPPPKKMRRKLNRVGAFAAIGVAGFWGALMLLFVLPRGGEPSTPPTETRAVEIVQQPRVRQEPPKQPEETFAQTNANSLPTVSASCNVTVDPSVVIQNLRQSCVRGRSACGPQVHANYTALLSDLSSCAQRVDNDADGCPDDIATEITTLRSKASSPDLLRRLTRADADRLDQLITCTRATFTAPVTAPPAAQPGTRTSTRRTSGARQENQRAPSASETDIRGTSDHQAVTTNGESALTQTEARNEPHGERIQTPAQEEPVSDADQGDDETSTRTVN